MDKILSGRLKYYMLIFFEADYYTGIRWEVLILRKYALKDFGIRGHNANSLIWNDSENMHIEREW